MRNRGEYFFRTLAVCSLILACIQAVCVHDMSKRLDKTESMAIRNSLYSRLP